jgi:archaemetzincin
MHKYFIFLLFLLVSCQHTIDKNTLVGIQPYEGFPKDKTDTIAKILATFYDLQTVVLEEIAHPKEAFTALKSPRYRADSLIKIQKQTKATSFDYILGLTSQDISVTKKGSDGKVKAPASKYADWGIMGLAYCPGNSCIVSTFRIKHPDKEKHFSRLKKVAVHEFGHNLGLPHCPDKACVMTDAVESVATIDNAQLALCKGCASKLK